MAASAYESLAFIIPVSGPGVTPGEQELYWVEAETKAAGFDDEAAAKAVLMRRLMLDVVLPEPMFQARNLSEALRLGDGSLTEAAELVYRGESMGPGQELDRVIDALAVIKGEPWTEFLYLDQIQLLFEGLTPEAWVGAKGQMGAVMVANPAEKLTNVHCPVLAIFGSKDTSLPVEQSVALYKQYLSEAGNEDVTIEVFPNANHSIQVGDDYAPGYFDLMLAWLRGLSAKRRW